jgi:hypothetical protein
MFPSIVLQTLCLRVALVISKDEVYILVDIIIVDPIRANLFTSNNFKVLQILKRVTKDNNNNKEINSYPLIIKVFGCLHKQVSIF